MVGKNNRFGTPLVALAMLTAATMLLSTAVQGQDVSKSIQIEGPLVNLLERKQDTGKSENDTITLMSVDQASKQKLLIPFQPSLGKFAIESPIKSLLIESGDLSGDSIATPDSLNLPNSAGKSPAKLSSVDRFVSKRVIEKPAEQLIDLGRIAEHVAAQLEVAPLVESKSKPNNPSVAPGLVDWHADLTTAALQSKISGKPVFHFQLLGQLDQRFT